MSKQKSISKPLIGMNRASSPIYLTEQEYSFQLNGNSYDSDGGKFSLTDEHSNILASKFKEGFKFIGGKAHVVRNKTYIFLTNPETGVSEIGYIFNDTNFSLEEDSYNNESCDTCNQVKEATPLEEQVQTEHQVYQTLLEDSCNLCLGFDINNPIFDIIIKEQNIGTKMFWTSTPGNKEFRYIELDDIEQYKRTGSESCGEVPQDTCLDCDKLRVFKLYKELKGKDYQRVLGGNLKKGSYEVLGAYSDQLGNEFTSYTNLTPIIPIFDEANIIHEQVDNNAETNFSIKVDLEDADTVFDFYKVVMRYYTSKGVFTTHEVGIYNTTNKTIIVSDNDGAHIPNTTIALKKPFVETVDGATASNNILILNGVREREPLNLQPVVNLMGLGVKWMSFRAKEDLYKNADSYKYLGYNRDENVALAIDFGMKDGYRTNPFIFIPRPATAEERTDFSTIGGDDYTSITNVVGDCDGTIRTEKWQFYNTATEIGVCNNEEDIPTVEQNETVSTYTTVGPVILTEGLLEVGKTYRIEILEETDDFTNVGFIGTSQDFVATSSTPTSWANKTQVYNITDGIPPVPSDSINTIDISAIENFTGIENFIEDNISNTVLLGPIAPYVDINNLTGYNNVPELPADTCQSFQLDPNETISITNVIGEVVEYTYIQNIEDYASISPPKNSSVFEVNTSDEEQRYLPDIEFSMAYDSLTMRYNNTDYQFRLVPLSKLRIPNAFNTTCNASDDLIRITDGKIISFYANYYHENLGSLTLTDLQNSNVNMDPSVVQGSLTGSDGIFTDKLHKGALWFKTEVFDRDKFYINLSKLVKGKRNTHTFSGGGFFPNKIIRYPRKETDLLRISFFKSCSDTAPIYSKIIDISDSTFITVDKEVSNGEILAILENSGARTLYISVEAPIKKSEGLGPDWDDNVYITDEDRILFDDINLVQNTYILLLPYGGWSIVDRDEEPETVSISWDSIEVSKIQKYTTDCIFEIPIIQDCKPVPYKYGELGYYESTETYPDNKELYDSSNLVISKSSITNSDLLNKLELYKDSEVDNNIVLSTEADFTCKPIRHYRTPDNKISPFINVNNIASNSDSIISPLGFTIDGEVVQNMLQVAVDNKLITDKQKENIVDYRIYRSDATLDRSVVASGLAFNTKTYTKDTDEIRYFNYPFNSLGKDKYFEDNTDSDFDMFQAISPEFDYFKPSLPNEISLQGFMFGKSDTIVSPVENHAKMVILGRKARNLASTLASLEAISEIVIAGATALSGSNIQVGFSTTVFSGGIVSAIAIASLETASAVVFKIGRYRLEWERTFENLGAPYNFGYYTTSASKYNYLKTSQLDGDRVRGASTRKYLGSGMLSISDTTSGKIVKLNNIDREEAPVFMLGDFPVENLPQEYLSFDNTDISRNFSSQVLSSEIGCDEGKSKEVLRNIASPYVAFKNYIPNQYGTVNSIKWVDTLHSFPIDSIGECNGILGGDTFISRHSKKRKTRLFETDLLGSADLTPFPYQFYGNYGNPKYYIDYKVNDEISSGGKLFPSIFYDVKFDCIRGNNDFYMTPPGKFYLYNISYVNFLCETRINTNFRNARKEPWNQFYPQNTDYEAITQPNTVGLTREESFFYNKAYLQTDVLNNSFLLPDYYSKEDEAKKAYNTNSGIYSLPDVNENSITEPWLLYRPNNKFTLESTYGDLINIRGIESDQILMYFENALQLQNAKNPFTDGSTQYNSDLGDGGIFGKRAITLRTTDLGYGGTQSKHTLSCEFGHFHADMVRGQVFRYLGGTDMEEISRYSNGKPNGMDVWFKEHLSLKFSKYFPNYGNTDNPYNGLGLHWGYDSKYRRVLLTKKDYIPTNKDIINCGDGLYDSNLGSYQDTINTYEAEGYTFEGIEDCSLKFVKESITNSTDIYAIFDTTSMQYQDGLDASTALNSWYNQYKTNNPDFEGNLYILPYGNEAYVSYPTIIKNGSLYTTTGDWSNITVAPPNLNTTQWVPPTDMLLLAFVDETHNEYHGSQISDDFTVGQGYGTLNGTETLTLTPGFFDGLSGTVNIIGAVNSSSPLDTYVTYSNFSGLNLDIASVTGYQSSSFGFINITATDGTNTQTKGLGLLSQLISKNLASEVLTNQPTSTFFSNYQDFLGDYNNHYAFFRGVLYPIVKNVSSTGGALVLQALAAIKGTTLTQQQIDDTNTTVDVSLLLTENPYESAPIPNTNPQEYLQPLENLGWVGAYDKLSPASEVFNSETFSQELNYLILGGEPGATIYEPLNEVSLQNEDYFKEVSWTISYKPETGSWESYMSYTPNYYLNHPTYFQSGINSEDEKHGLWSHLLTNKSYRVFYGHKFPYIVEYPIKNEYFSKSLESLNWNAMLKRYHNEYDYAPLVENPFTSVTIYNNYENSGELKPVLNKGTLSQMSKYPITNSDNTQDVLVSYSNYRYNLNYFYNRVLSNTNNQPIWLWDENQINKELNKKTVSFYGKKTLERLKGNYFIVRLERDGNTNYDLDFRWSEQTINPVR